MRFVIDDGAFRNWDLCAQDLTESLSVFSELLQDLRKNRRSVGLLSGWGGLRVTKRDDLATVLTRRADLVDKDLGRLVLGLLSKCKNWDEDSSVVVSDDDLFVGEKRYESLGVAYAFAEIAERRGVGVLTMLHTGLIGPCRVGNDGHEGQLVFVVRPSEYKYFYRTLYALENIGEDIFFDLASDAFPDLYFTDDLNFSKFEGGYGQRDNVVEHLGALNDDFLQYFASEKGDSKRISSYIGIDVSIEGETRSSERLMAMRDVIFNGRTYRCEWHSKLQPHIDRIHFFPGDESTERKILVGIFVKHLPT